MEFALVLHRFELRIALVRPILRLEFQTRFLGSHDVIPFDINSAVPKFSAPIALLSVPLVFHTVRIKEGKLIITFLACPFCRCPIEAFFVGQSRSIIVIGVPKRFEHLYAGRSAHGWRVREVHVLGVPCCLAAPSCKSFLAPFLQDELLVLL